MKLAYKWQVTIIMVIGLFMSILDNTIVSVALPQIQKNLNVSSYDTVTWVATAYFLAQAAVIPITGFMIDLVGSKWVFIVSLTLFTIGSFLCSLAPSFPMLIFFRVLQGLGGGALMPVVFAEIFRVFPPSERGPASAVIGVPILLAPAFGPTIGGYFTTTFDWNSIFKINVPIGILAVILAFWILKSKKSEDTQYGVNTVTRSNFDILGLILSMAGFTTLVYAITEAGINGWTDHQVELFLGIGGVLLAVFVVVELLVKDPVLDMRLFKVYSFTMGNIVTWALSAFLFGSLFLLPFFFQNVQGVSALTSGEYLMSQGLAAAFATAVAGRLYNVIGPRWLTFFGMLIVAIATIGFMNLTIGTSGWDLQGWFILRGLGLGLTNVPLQTFVVSRISNRDLPRASSLVSVTRQVFSSIGVAVLTAYLTTQATSQGNTLGAQINTQFASKPPTGEALHCITVFGKAGSAAIQQCAKNYIFQNATTTALNETFTFVLIGCLAATLIALFIGKDPNVELAKDARKRGETVESRPAMIGE